MSTEHLWTHKLCCVNPINVDPNEPERFDRLAYFQQLEALAAAGGTLVVSPATERCIPAVAKWDETGTFLALYLRSRSPNPERIHQVRRPV